MKKVNIENIKSRIPLMRNKLICLSKLIFEITQITFMNDMYKTYDFN